MQSSELIDAAAELGVSLNSDQHRLLVDYVDLVRKWNMAFNLVSRRDVGRLWSRHVLDSLSVLPIIEECLAGAEPAEEKRALDAGTGAGFPGLPLAIADAGIEWELADRNARKVRFLDTVVASLDIPNVTTRCRDLGVAGDLENERFDLVTSRGVDRPRELVALLGRYLKPGGSMILLTAAGKDSDSPTEAEELPAGFCRAGVRRFEIPGLDRAHEVTIIRLNGTAPEVS